MNFKLNLMLIPFTVPRTAFNYLPSCDIIILNFPFRLAKSRPMGGCSLDAHCGGCLHFQFSIIQSVCKNLRILRQASRKWFIEYEYEIRT